MRKLKLLLVLVLMFAVLPMQEAFANSDGLLRGKLMNLGADKSSVSLSLDNFTDGRDDYGASVGASGSNTDTLWYEFSTPVEISSYQLSAYQVSTKKNVGYRLELLDSTGSLLWSNENAIATGVKTDIARFTNVKKLVYTNTSAEPNSVFEIEVFGGSTPTTPEQPTGDRAILVITLVTGTEKEYDLPMSEVSAFIDWYDSSNGIVKYGINKHNNNKGPFNKRTEYVIHDKILTFEVSEYTAH
ncbi:hypothetical protein KDC22_14580 [Paenibacillus tritici]|uniref:hypothetical protein n=1 Tax=Paenibacillus tritici TaxID=1873425 RepID=UPI001BA7CFD4|nr:hypothetical protein [Paenibacillus tritici]QUL57592.1 hypothetical protein KDC22_14580 [Paenibacillus tritici]